MQYIKECAIFGGTFVGMFFMGALHPLLGFITLAAWLIYCWPRFWRATVIRNAEVDEKRRKQNIETQIIRGKLDAKNIRDVANQMKRDGRL